MPPGGAVRAPAGALIRAIRVHFERLGLAVNPTAGAAGRMVRGTAAEHRTTAQNCAIGVIACDTSSRAKGVSCSCNAGDGARRVQ
jgi:hypothetical protein